MTTSINRYVAQRTELLATLILTRRKDVQVFSLGDKRDLGIDLVARIAKPVMSGQVIPTFGIEVMGTSDPLEDEDKATRHANQRWKHRASKGLLLFPIVLLLFSMEGDVGYYSWIMEPHVTKERGPSLIRVSPFDMTKINKKVLDELIRRVEEWFESMAEILLQHVPTT